MEKTLIGKYKLLEEIGRGGMGIVYRGEQVSLKQIVAIKTLLSEFTHDQEYLDRIENEARILAKFSHPCIVYIHDVEKQADAIYLIMEYVPGITLTERIKKEGPYDIKEAARIIVRVAAALDHAHNKGIIHRDIKPSNIMIREDGVVKVTDFGIAKSSEPSDMTRGRFTPGTFDYMSPEQKQGNKELDGRSDIYSLGIVFYQMVTGKLPPFPLPARLPDFPSRYAKILKKCLAEDMTKRYSSARDLVNALDEADKKSPALGMGKKTGQENPFRIAAIGGAIGAVFLLAVSIWQYDQIKQYATILLFKNDTKTARPTLVEPAEQTDTAPIGPLTALRSAADRKNELLEQIFNYQGTSVKRDVRRIFALRACVIENTRHESDLVSSVRSLFHQMDMVRADNHGGCDLLAVMSAGSQGVSLNIQSNLSGDEGEEAYQELFSFYDDQHLLSSLENLIHRYYSLNILSSLELLNPADDAYAAGITFTGGYNDNFRVGETIRICMDSRLRSYSVLLSVNLEGLYLLFPQTREEHVSHLFTNPICSEPMAVSPPTGTVLIVTILFADKTLLPIAPYLAGEEQLFIEPAYWSYDLSATENAVEFSENLFLSLHNALSGGYSTKSRFIKTYQ